MSNRKLNSARVTKNNEWYTRMEDVRAELEHYKEQFKGKVVFCPCDDVTWSNFARYFAENFETFGLKRLICSCYYAPQVTSLYTILDGTPEMKRGYWAEYRGNNVWERHNYQHGNGDFRSQEVTELLKQCDIVVTNPPFSLFKNFVAWVLEQSKDLLVLGPKTALTYKGIFPHIQSGKIRTGWNAWFDLVCYGEKGELLDGVAVNWYTTLKTKPCPPLLELQSTYDPAKHKKIINYDAINVDSVKEIPMDYYDVMAVPVTFLKKWNPKQFEIIGMSNILSYSPIRLQKINGINAGSTTNYTVGAIFLQDDNGIYFNAKDNKRYKRLFSRIFIKRVDNSK